jgi:hypothetical protein
LIELASEATDDLEGVGGLGGGEVVVASEALLGVVESALVEQGYGVVVGGPGLVPERGGAGVRVV